MTASAARIAATENQRSASWPGTDTNFTPHSLLGLPIASLRAHCREPLKRVSTYKSRTFQGSSSSVSDLPRMRFPALDADIAAHDPPDLGCLCSILGALQCFTVDLAVGETFPCFTQTEKFRLGATARTLTLAARIVFLSNGGRA